MSAGMYTEQLFRGSSLPRAAWLRFRESGDLGRIYVAPRIVPCSSGPLLLTLRATRTRGTAVFRPGTRVPSPVLSERRGSGVFLSDRLRWD